ncbi:MAG: hypothetical protein IPK59_00620 [Rhodospirillaceae bacterium]|nr:hypothetical protein [Rhodospirillaceae bacterium]
MSMPLRPISRRRVAFAKRLVASGGNATAAALAAGYRPGARAIAARLLHDDRVLALVAAEIKRGAPGAAEALRRLMLPSRPAVLRYRLELLLRDPQPVKLIGSHAAPLTLANPDDTAMRDFAVRLAVEIGPKNAPAAVLGAEIGCLEPEPTGNTTEHKDFSTRGSGSSKRCPKK